MGGSSHEISKKEVKRKNVSVYLHIIIFFSLGRQFPKPSRAGVCIRLRCSPQQVQPKTPIPCLASYLFFRNVIYQFCVYQKVSALDLNIWTVDLSL